MPVLGPHIRPNVAQLMRGHIDFYYLRGQLIARSWPRKPLGTLNPNVQATATTFGDTIREASNLHPALRDQLIAQTHGTDWTWRDALIASLYASAVNTDIAP